MSPNFLSRCATSPGLQVWLRIGAYAHEHNGQPLEPGELSQTLNLTEDQINVGIQTAIGIGLLHPTSTTTALYVHSDYVHSEQA